MPLRHRTRAALTVAATLALALTGVTTSIAAGQPTARPAVAHWALDPTFGDDGVVTTDFPFGSDHFGWADADAIQPDGRILAAGFTEDGRTIDEVASIARYMPDGRLDTSFGDQGRVMLGPHARYTVDKIALQQINGQQKIVLAVETTYRSPLRYRCSIVRLNPDGTLDTDHDSDPSVVFGDEGTKVVRFFGNSGFCPDIAITADNNIDGILQANGHRGDVAAFQLLGDTGQPDPAFSGNGKVILVRRGFQVPTTIALQPQTSGPPALVIGGLVSRPHGYDWALWRIKATGQLDTGFGHDGTVVTPMRDPQVQQSFDTIRDVVIGPDRSIIAVGRYRAWPDDERFPQDTAAAAKYLPDGRLDSSFGDHGRTHLPWREGGETEAVSATLDPAGDILYTGTYETPLRDLVLIGGFLPDGSLDSRFGQGLGYQFVQRGLDGYGLSLDEEGRMVVAGSVPDPRGSINDRMGVLRFAIRG